jgi:hypothetical protein
VSLSGTDPLRCDAGQELWLQKRSLFITGFSLEVRPMDWRYHLIAYNKV